MATRKRVVYFRYFAVKKGGPPAVAGVYPKRKSAVQREESHQSPTAILSESSKGEMGRLTGVGLAVQNLSEASSSGAFMSRYAASLTS